MQKSVDHVAHKVSLFQRAILPNTHVGQEIVFKQEKRVLNTSLQVMLRLGASLRDVVESIVSSADLLDLFERRPEQINHVGVVLVIDHQVLDLLVTDHIQSSEQDTHWDVLFDHGDLYLDRLTLVARLLLGGQFDSELLGRFVCVFSY